MMAATINKQPAREVDPAFLMFMALTTTIEDGMALHAKRQTGGGLPAQSSGYGGV